MVCLECQNKNFIGDSLVTNVNFKQINTRIISISTLCSISPEFFVGNGFKQGRIISPILFNIYILLLLINPILLMSFFPLFYM